MVRRRRCGGQNHTIGWMARLDRSISGGQTDEVRRHGAGETGSRYGGWLVNAGLDVTFIARGQRYEEIKRNGLRAQPDPSGKRTDIAHVKITNTPAEVGPVDVVIFNGQELSPGRSCRTDEAAAGRRYGRAPHAKRCHRSRTSGHDCRPPACARLRHFTPDPGDWELDGPVSPRVQAVWAVLTGAGVQVDAVDDIRIPLWQKAPGIRKGRAQSWWPASILARLRHHRSFRRPGVGGWRRSGRGGKSRRRQHYSRNGRLAAGDSWTTSVRATRTGGRPSCRISMRAGALELEDLVGVIVHKGAQHGIPTPVIRVCYMTLKPYEMGIPRQ